MDKQLIEDLKESLNEAIEHAEGKKELRTTTLSRPPKKLSNIEIAGLRGEMNVSQAVFAR